MAITRKTYTERVLIVLNPDGSMKGAHQEGIEFLKDGTELLSAKQLPAAPLDAATLASVLPGTAALTAQVDSLQRVLVDANAAKATAETERDQARQEKATAEIQRDAAIVERAEAQSALAAALSRLAELHAASTTPSAAL